MSTSFLKTVINFTKNIKTTGAFYKTSAKVETEICSKISGSSKVVVEFGVGYGNITQKILENLPSDGKLYAFEVNEEFCATVREKIKDPRLHIFNQSALHVRELVQEPVDNFISSIPFTLIPKDDGNQIIRMSYEILKENGFFSQVLYSKYHLNRFQKYFQTCEVKVIPNIPVEHIYHCFKAPQNGK